MRRAQQRRTARAGEKKRTVLKNTEIKNHQNSLELRQEELMFYATKLRSTGAKF
jgi:hypothetical protein